MHVAKIDIDFELITCQSSEGNISCIIYIMYTYTNSLVCNALGNALKGMRNCPADQYILT